MIDKHVGVYGILIKNDKILLIKKANGPYQGKLDSPGGGIKFGEEIEDALKREFREETNLNITNFTLFDVVIAYNDWYENNKLIKGQHIAIFYLIKDYTNEIKKELKVDDTNDDSLGAEFYKISELTTANLSKITIKALTKLGYNLK